MNHSKRKIPKAFRCGSGAENISQPSHPDALADLQISVLKPYCVQLLTSCPSSSMMAPACSTTSNIITEQSSLLTDIVMFAKAGS